jgi:hypothetical protein
VGALLYVPPVRAILIELAFAGKKALDCFSDGSLWNTYVPGCLFTIVLNPAFFRNLCDQVPEIPLSGLMTSGLEGAPETQPTIFTLDVKRAITQVEPNLPATWSEEPAWCEVTPIGVWFVVLVHDITLPQVPLNQWINSFVLRFEYTRAAALGETMIVV